MMQTKTFTSGRIGAAHFDPASGQLDLHRDNKAVLAYKHVPQEGYRRLCSAPNPAAYWEDRIAEEWLEQIQPMVLQRARLQECVQGLRSINDAAFTNFTSFLLSDTAAATSVRQDLVDMLPGSDQVAVRLEQTLQQFPKRERLPKWMAPFRFKRQ